MVTRPLPRHVVFVVCPGFQSLDLTGPFEVFAAANEAASSPAYRLTVVSLTGGPIASESGLAIGTERLDTVLHTGLHTGSDVHTLVIPGGNGVRAAIGDEALVAAIGELAAQAERVVTVCTGAFLAAAAGVATGRTVTTHWHRAEALQRRFPDINVDADPIFIRDGNLWSSAGVTAGIDLALAIVEHDLGGDVAQTIARHLVMFLRRPGGQSQFATPIWSERAEAEPIRHAQHHIDAHPGDDHRLDLLAQRAGMSSRHFARCFTAQTGVPPGKYVTMVRVEAARRALETTDATIDSIAMRCGFGTAETMRRSFHRQLGVSPDDYRNRFRLAPASIRTRKATS
ncbi:MAG TPA: helix-turn-helix domain-containing protein [Ilumatobacter sp.]|nr:helix-turn-helix domain-containing protein [Ilumatobacter sp.]